MGYINAPARIGLTILIIFSVCLALNADTQENSWTPKEGTELIGTKAPSLKGLKWLNSEPQEIEGLEGRVVLIRFWLVGCPFCENTAPSLVELNEKYSDRGLVILGIHHPKSERTKDPELVIKVAENFGYDFPIAQDTDWEVINRYWLGGKERTYTSSTFLVDKNGIIKLVHDGGEFYRSSDDQVADSAYRQIESKIEELLSK